MNVSAVSLLFQFSLELLHWGFNYYDSRWFTYWVIWILISKLSHIWSTFIAPVLHIFFNCFIMQTSLLFTCFPVQLIFELWWILVFCVWNNHHSDSECSLDFSDLKLDRHILQVPCNLQCKCCLIFSEPFAYFTLIQSNCLKINQSWSLTTAMNLLPELVEITCQYTWYYAESLAQIYVCKRDILTSWEKWKPYDE